MQSMHVNQRRVRPLVANCVHAIKLSGLEYFYAQANEIRHVCHYTARNLVMQYPSSFFLPSKFSNPDLSFPSFASSQLSNPYQPMEFARYPCVPHSLENHCSNDPFSLSLCRPMYLSRTALVFIYNVIRRELAFFRGAAN